MQQHVLSKLVISTALFPLLLLAYLPAQAGWVKLECRGSGGFVQTYALNRNRSAVRVDNVDAVNVEYSANFVEFDILYPNGKVYEHALNLEDLTLRIMEKTLGIILPLQKCVPLSKGSKHSIAEDLGQ